MSDCVNGCPAPAESAYRHARAEFCAGCLRELRSRLNEALSSGFADHQRAESAEQLAQRRFEELADMRARWEAAEARIAELERDCSAMRDGAWGVIANAGGGMWAGQSMDWQRAAAHWRDAWVYAEGSKNGDQKPDADAAGIREFERADLDRS